MVTDDEERRVVVQGRKGAVLVVGVVAACVLCGCTCTYGGACEEMSKCVYNNTGECAGVAKAHECVCAWG